MDRSLTLHPIDVQSRRSVKGFTIIEVMVALAILSIALTAIYRLQGQTMMMSAKSRFYSLAPMLAQTKLAEVEHQPHRELSEASGDFGEAYPGYNWALHFEDITTELLTEKYYHLTRIDIDIAQNEENRYHLRTYRFFVD
jgi:general secretion pathway protein I